MWRHWYGLTQAWGSTTYDWTLGQILPRCREESCQQNLTEALSKRRHRFPWGKPYHGRIHIWDYPKGNQAIRTPSPVQGLTGDPGELTPVLGLASDCSARSDCGGAWRIPPGFTVRGTELGEKKALVSPGEGEWRSKHDTGQFFPPITCYPTHGKRLAQRGDCRILRRCSVSPSLQLCRCPPERRRAPTHGRRQHSEWSEPSPPGGMARLEIGMPRQQHPLSSGPTSVWRQPSLSADLRGRQRAAQSFSSSGCGPRICAMLLWDTAVLRLDLPPPRAVLAGSPPDRRRAWWEPWAPIQAGVSRQHESRSARTQGTLRLPRMPGGPRPVWWKWARN